MIDTVKKSIVRIFSSSNKSTIVGAGFLIDHREKLIVTCAHVVNAAIGKTDNTAKPRANIYFDFPFINSSTILRASTILFKPKQDNHSGDIAILKVSDLLPEEACVPNLKLNNSHSGNRFEVFGFPQSVNEKNGRWVEGKLQQSIANGQIQAIGTSEFGNSIERGFSGSPVYDVELDCVIGMIARVDSNPEKRTSFIIPLNKIQEVFPHLRYEGPLHTMDNNIYYLSVDNIKEYLQALSDNDKLGFLFTQIKSTLDLALRIFIISTIRIYEHEIVNLPKNYELNALPVQNLISSFRSPAFSTIRNLAEKCFYLIDNSAPLSLIEMKKCLDATIRLGSIGNFWNDLERKQISKNAKNADKDSIPRDTLKGNYWSDSEKRDPSKKTRFANKHNLRRSILRQLLKELELYMQSTSDELIGDIEEDEDVSINPSDWLNALIEIRSHLHPIFQFPFAHISVKEHNPLTGEFVFDVKTYTGNQVVLSAESKARIDDTSLYRTEMVIDSNKKISVYPFLIIREDALFYYQRTTSVGYEFYSPLLDKKYVEHTKKAFRYSLFQVENLQLGSQQEMFWADAKPETNSRGIRANIPSEQRTTEFIGRKKQISEIYNQVLTIVNENGIVFGPGGMGKTALIIELSEQLYQENDKEKILFENIIWVTAKLNYYDFVAGKIEKRDPQVRSLDTILLTILRFFEYEGIESYTHEDRKELVLDILYNNRVLLIIDNFESINKTETENILRFFGTEVKIYLRHRPSNFKVIITSRELISAGFRQIPLSGMTKIESKKLIKALNQRYEFSQNPLTESQQDQLYDATRGIPIVIKHCIARLYEYRDSFASIVHQLPSNASTVVQFSFSEILSQISKDKNKENLEILFLLDIAGIPLMTRQIADILEFDESLVEDRIPTLSKFECIKRVLHDNREKYTVNEEIYLLIRNLISQQSSIYQKVRTKHYYNFSFEKRMDYTQEEENIVSIFESYLKQRDLANAQDFIERELASRPESILLSYYYARHLYERQNNADYAITVLQKIRKTSRNHPSVLKLLFLCYASSSIPRFEDGNVIADQIQVQMSDFLSEDLDLQFGIACFYVAWSISLKADKGIDWLGENIRRAKYKELAKKALDLLLHLEKSYKNLLVREQQQYKFEMYEIHHRMAQCYYNLWDYDEALRSIDQAIDLAPQNVKREYVRFKKGDILRLKQAYGD